MEALAAIAFAGNIAQFVEYSIKAILKTPRLLESANGAWVENTELEGIVDSVKKSLQGVHESRDTSNNGAVLDPILENLTASCLAVSGEIMAILDRLKLEDPGAGFFQGMQKTAKSLVKRSELKDLCDRLQLLRDQISAHLLVLIRWETISLRDRAISSRLLTDPK